MKLGEIYRHCVEKGMAEDERGHEELQRLLDDARKAYEKLDEDDKDFFDTERHPAITFESESFRTEGDELVAHAHERISLRAWRLS